MTVLQLFYRHSKFKSQLELPLAMKDDLMSVKPILHSSFLDHWQLRLSLKVCITPRLLTIILIPSFLTLPVSGSRDQLNDNAWNGLKPRGFIELIWITFLNNLFLANEKFPIFWLLVFSYKSKHNLAVHHIEGFTLRRPRTQKHILTYWPQQVTKLNVFKARIQNDTRNWL